MSSVQHLRNVPIFSDLKDSDLNIISDKMISRAYKKGQMILLEESQGETFFIIVSGAVKVTRLSDDGREVILASLAKAISLVKCLCLMAKADLQILLQMKMQKF